jgi:hypothetical protein
LRGRRTARYSELRLDEGIVGQGLEVRKRLEFLMHWFSLGFSFTTGFSPVETDAAVSLAEMELETVKTVPLDYSSVRVTGLKPV